MRSFLKKAAVFFGIFTVLCSLSLPGSCVFSETETWNQMKKEEYIFDSDMSILIAYDFLQNNMEFNRAVASGIIANFVAESGIRTTALGDGGTSYGICQWHNERWADLIFFSRNIGRPMEDIQTQLLFFRYEMCAIYPDLYRQLSELPDNEDGAYKAAYVICTDYESPANAEEAARNRGEIGISTYNKSLKSFSCEIPVMEIIYMLAVYQNGYTDPLISVHGEIVLPNAQGTYEVFASDSMMTYDDIYWGLLEAQTETAADWKNPEELLTDYPETGDADADSAEISDESIVPDTDSHNTEILQDFQGEISYPEEPSETEETIPERTENYVIENCCEAEDIVL